MNLVAFAVRRWQLTLVIFLLAAALGIQAFMTIPRSADPNLPIPIVIVTVILPGADAAEVEETVAKPIEEVVQGIDRIREIKSTSTNGVVVVTAEFDYGSDVDQSLDRVVRDVNTIRQQLPSGIARLSFRRARPTEAALLQYALVSENASWRRLDKYTQDFRDRINVISGVRNTQVFGMAEPEVRVAIDQARLFEAGVPPTRIVQAVEAGGGTIAGGSVTSGERRLNVDAGGSYRTLSAIENALVTGEAGRVMRVGDVAKVDWAEAEQTHYTRLNGERAVWIAVRQKDGTNSPELRNRIEAAAGSFRETLPPDIKLEVAFDQTVDVKRRLNDLGRDFGIALALVLITLIPLGMRSALVVIVSIPLSLAMGVFVLAQLGHSLNQLSISGFVISLGLLVDDSIVVTESIGRKIREGMAATQAAIEGTREIAVAVIGSTGVLIFAFLPLCFIPESSGDFVRTLPLAVLATVSASLIVSLTIIPFLASRLLTNEHGPEGNRALRAVNGAIHRFYQPMLHRGLANPKKTVWGAMIVCIGALGLLPLIGASLFPTSDAPYFIVRVETPEGSTLDATDRAVRQVSRIVAEFPGLSARMDNSGRGNPQIFYNNFSREEDTRYGEVFITVDRWSPSRGPQQLDDLRAKLQNFPGALVKVVQFENGPPVDAPVAIRLRGPEIAPLKELSAKVATIMAGTPGLRDIENPLAVDRVDLDLGFDDASASLLGVVPNDFRRAVRIGLIGERASTFRDSEGDAYPVVVRMPLDRHQPVSALQSIYVPTQRGGSVPLAEVADPKLKSAPARITRFQLERTVTVTAYNESGALPSKLNQTVVAKLADLKMPPGYRWEIGGAAEVAARNTSGLGGVILFAVFGIFAVLVAEFGRFREVAVVAGVIPLGVFGGIIALLITGNSLSLIATIGFVALIGIEIKNSILLVDLTSSLRDEGASLLDAIERAGEIRFLPVLLTSLTAIGGMLPLALSGAPLYAPLAWVIIGGLISSTLLSRIVTPVMYLLIARRDEDLGAA